MNKKKSASGAKRNKKADETNPMRYLRLTGVCKLNTRFE